MHAMANLGNLIYLLSYSIAINVDMIYLVYNFISISITENLFIIGKCLSFLSKLQD